MIYLCIYSSDSSKDRPNFYQKHPLITSAHLPLEILNALDIGDILACLVKNEPNELSKMPYIRLNGILEVRYFTENESHAQQWYSCRNECFPLDTSSKSIAVKLEPAKSSRHLMGYRIYTPSENSPKISPQWLKRIFGDAEIAPHSPQKISQEDVDELLELAGWPNAQTLSDFLKV